MLQKYITVINLFFKETGQVPENTEAVGNQQHPHKYRAEC